MEKLLKELSETLVNGGVNNMSKCMICGKEKELNSYGICRRCHEESELKAREMFKALFGEEFEETKDKEEFKEFYDFKKREEEKPTCELCDNELEGFDVLRGVCDDCTLKLFDDYDKSDMFSDITIEMLETYIKKNNDYGDSFGKMYKEFGLTGSAIRISDKINRFKTLINTNSKVKDESIEDTLLDLANYAIMTVIEMRLDK